MGYSIETLNPLLRGWIGYLRLTESRKSLAELDGWVRGRRRCLRRRPRKRIANAVV